MPSAWLSGISLAESLESVEVFGMEEPLFRGTTMPELQEGLPETAGTKWRAMEVLLLPLGLHLGGKRPATCFPVAAREIQYASEARITGRESVCEKSASSFSFLAAFAVGYWTSFTATIFVWKQFEHWILSGAARRVKFDVSLCRTSDPEAEPDYTTSSQKDQTRMPQVWRGYGVCFLWQAAVLGLQPLP